MAAIEKVCECSSDDCVHHGGDMEDIKVKASNESERKEIQELLSKLGYNLVNNIACEKGFVVASLYSSGINFDYYADVKEIKLQYLRDLVVLKRNSIDDATHYYGDSKYYLTDSEFYQYSENKWVNIDEHVDGMTFKKIKKEVKMKEYLVKNMYGDYVLTDHHSGFSVEDLIEVPEGAEILYFDKRYKPSNHFFKTVGGNSYYKYLDSGSKWMKYDDVGLNEFKDNIEDFRVVWQRNVTTLDGNNTSTKEKLKFIEKWLNGEKIQYILGEETDKSQWHNLTEGAMQYIKRSDIKFREAPKYVTINGVEFKSVERLLKYVKNNFDLEDGEFE